MPLLILLPMLGLALLLAGFGLVGGPNPTREAARRLHALRMRHSDLASERLEAQYRRVVAARRPTTARGGTNARIEALALRLERSGLGWTVPGYIKGSTALALAIAVLIALRSGSIPVAIIVGVVIGAGLPHMIVRQAINRRTRRFVGTFPDALELLVRALRSGLPISETLFVVASELTGPVSAEFKRVGDRVRVGRTMEEAMNESADRLDLPEFSFFCITLAIQRETGGNLAETLANLAEILRKRAQMKLKVKAMSAEAKTSAWIVGALPFVVLVLIGTSNPAYIGRFLVDQRLVVAGSGAFAWLMLGVFIMSRMVSFEI